MKKHLKARKLVSIFVFATLLITIVFLILRIFLAPATPEASETTDRTKSDYVLMLLQCTLGIVAMLLPGILEKKLQIEIPSSMIVLFVIFLYCAIFLGEVGNFYYNIKNWDTILHCFSGAMLGALGFSFITLLNKSERVPMNLSPIFVALFSFCFGVTLGVVWEIYEFTFDGLLGLNMQKFALQNGTLLFGRAALADTMKDLIVDGIGALVISAIGYISLRYKKGWVDKLLIRSKKGKSENRQESGGQDAK
jgi:hypothetical protein